MDSTDLHIFNPSIPGTASLVLDTVYASRSRHLAFLGIGNYARESSERYA